MKRWTVLVLAFGLLSWGGHAQSSVPPEILALAEDLSVEVERALQEAAFAWIAPTLGDVKSRAQRVVNVLEGSEGEHFDPGPGNPGDGLGALNHAQALSEALEGTPWEDFSVTAFTIREFATWARGQAVKTLGIEDEEEARREIHKAEAYLRAALGCSDDLPTQGGARTILEHMKNGSSAQIELPAPPSAGADLTDAH